MRQLELLTPALLVAGFVSSFSHDASAQTPYITSHSNGTYVPLAGGTVHTPVLVDPMSGFDAWDEGFVQITIPFGFTFFGGTYTTVYVHTNGFISFSPFPANGPSILGPPFTVPSTSNTVHNFIGVAWDDLDGSGGTGEIRSETVGAAPNRTFVIQVSGLHEFFNPAGSNVIFQIRLHEGSAQFDVVFGANAGIAGATSAVENADGTEGFNLMGTYPGCAAGCTCAPAACGSPNWQPVGRTISVQLPNEPELTATLTAPPGVYPGNTFPVDLALRNLGLMPAGSYAYQLFLSTSNTSITGATPLGTFTQNGQGPSSVVNVTRNPTMPPSTPVGTYYVAVSLDINNTVAEVIETNNIAFSGPINTAPDLTAIVEIPAITGPGEVLDVDFTLQNLGAPVTTPISVSFYFSQDPTLDAFDLGVPPQLFTMPDGFTFSGPVSITVPPGIQPSPPNYYVIADVDDTNQVAEPNENNNEITSATTILVDGPDLAVDNFVGDDIGFRGLVYPVQFRIDNQGGATARDFTACVVISDNLLISLVTDEVLLETGLMTLAPGESRTMVLQPTIPTDTATGAWYIAGVADCQTVVNEALETNNIGRRNQQIIIRDVAPDFIPLEVSTTSAAASGEQLPVSVRFANLGNATGSTHIRVVISDNPGITDMDRAIYDSATATQLAPPGETTASVWAAIPGDLPSGTYYVGAIVDPNGLVDEIYEDNNTAGVGPIVVVGADLAIVSPPPPPAIIGVAYTRRFSAVGGTTSYVWELTWANDAPAGITFDAALGELRGMPAAGADGSYPFTLRVTSGNLVTARDYNLIVTPPTIGLEVVSSQLPPALAQEPYSVELVAVGGTPPYSWSLGGGNVPPGVSVSQLGELGGEPQVVGAYTFEVEVRDLTGAAATGLLALDVVDPSASITITTADVPDGEVGSSYETAFSAAGGSAPYTWRLDGDIPPGLMFTGETALLSGTPTVAGDYAIIIEVRDDRGLLDRNAYVLRILEEGALQITNGQSSVDGLPNGKVGTPYEDPNGEPVRLRAVKPGADLDELVWSILDGALPPGILLDSETGILSGTPEQAGGFPFIVQVRDARNDVARTSLVIFVEDKEDLVEGPDGGCGCNAAERGRGSISLLVLAAIALWVVRRRKVLMLSALLAAPMSAEAQPVPYQIFEEVVPFVPLPQNSMATPGLGDGDTFAIPLPFDFYFYGNPHNTIWVNANGLIGVVDLGFGNHFPPTSIPSSATPNAWIAGLWSDWCADAAGCFGVSNPGMGIFYSMDSTPGIGSITIEFRRLRHYSDDSVPSSATFQITLHEGLSSMIELHYGPTSVGIDFLGQPTPIEPRIGMENVPGNDGMWVGPCQASPCDNPTYLGLPDQRITLIADAGEDVTVAGVQVPQVAYPGLPFSSSARIISRHQNPLGPFRYSVHLIPATSTSTAGGLLVYEGGPITLGAYESRVVTFDVEVPNDQAVGQYRVGVFVDHLDVLDETSELNNFAFSAQSVRIADRAPDFRVVSILPLTSQLRPGDTLEVEYVVQNFGNEPGRLELQAYLSANEAITISDLPLGTPVGADTVARETLTGTVSAVVPAGITTGAYYVGLILDSALMVPELDEANNVGRSAERIVVASTQVVILTEDLPPATLGQGYSARVIAAGGAGSFVFEVVSGDLPPGMVFTPAGELAGIPLGAGVFSLEIRATSNGVVGTKTLDLQVLDPDYALTILSRSMPDGTLGSDYVVSLNAVGGSQPYSWRITEGSLPRGILLAPDGTIFGAPSQAGFTSFSVEVRDNVSATSSVSLTLDVRSPGNLTIVTSDLNDAELDEPYSQQLVAVGGVAPLTWRAVETEMPQVPPGLTVSADGVLTGIPEKAGSFRFRVEVTDARGTADTNEVTLDVLSTGRFAIAITELPVGEPNQMYRAVVKAEGGDFPYTWEVVRGEGFLPPGFVVEQSEGIAEGETENDLIVRGTLESEGQWAFTARVYDAKGRFDERPFAIVSRAPASMLTPIDDEGCGCTSIERKGSALWCLLLLPLIAFRLRRFLRRGLSWLLLALLFVLLEATPAEAQYVFVRYDAPFIPLSGGTPLNLGGDTDDGNAVVTLPFAFTYYGAAYTTISVGVNGAALLSNSCAAGCDIDYESVVMPSTDPPDRILAVLWDDLVFGVSPNSTMTMQTFGTAPNREVVFEWRNLAHYDFFAESISRASFQLRLDEASGAVRYHYGTFVNAADDFLWDLGVIGIENTDGTAAVVPLTCGTLRNCGATDLDALENEVIEFVVPTGAELVGSMNSGTGGDPGAPLNLDLTVQNVGPQASVAFEVTFYFSTDTQIQTTDTPLGTINVAALPSMGSAMQTFNTTVPNLAPGIYTVGAIIDSGGDVTETIERNNTIVATTTFLVGADVAVAIEPLPPTGPNEAGTADVTVFNQGSAQPAVGVAVWLSSDTTLDLADHLIGTATVPIPAQPSTAVSVPTVVPANIVPGEYWAIAQVDFTDAIAEANENNNTGVSLVTTMITGADVVATEISAGGDFIFIGGQLQVSGTIRNEGGATTPPFFYAFHLSENELINSLTDPLLDELGPITLVPGQSVRVMHTVDVPANLTPGPYYLGLIADSQSSVLEQFEANNIGRTTQQIEARDPAPDFTAAEIRLPELAAAGESLVVSRTLLNAGNAPGGIAYELYLSDDAAIDPALDTLIGTGTIALDGFREDLGVDAARIPPTVPAGDYYVGYSLDPTDAQEELREDNNLIASEATVAVLASELTILTQQLPIAVIGARYEVLLGARGGAGGHVWSIASGALPAGLMLDPEGLLSGTTDEEGFHTIAVAVTDGALETQKSFVLIVAPETLPLEIVTRSLLPAFVGSEYRYPLTAFGGIPPYRWTVDGPLPAGITFDAAGLLSGTPTAPSVDTLTFRVDDASGAFAERPIAVRVVSPDDTVRFSDDVLPDGRLSEQYDVMLRVAPGTGTSPFTYALAGGALPNGLILEFDRIYGIPNQVGLFSFALRVTDTRNDFDVNRYVVEIAESSGLTFVTNSLPRAVLNQPYLAEGGEPIRLRAVSTEPLAGMITYRVVGGEHPPGLTLGEDGLISGTPTSVGPWAFTVLASDEQGQFEARAFGILVEEEELAPTPMKEEGCGCTAAREEGGFGWAVLLLLGLFLRRRSLLVLASCLAFPAIADAQYLTQTYTEPYLERSGGTVIPFPDVDDEQATITLPFPFRFFSGTYTQVTVGTNGFVTFGLDGESRFNEPIPSQNPPNELIAAFWDDLLTNVATTIVEGAAPNRAFIVQWEDAESYSDPSGGQIAMQVILYEGLGGRFEVRYGPITNMTDPFVWAATSGYEDVTGLLGSPILACNASCTGDDFAAATNTVFAFFQDGGTDIVAEAIVAPDLVYPGIAFEAPLTLESLHMNPLGPFVYEIHLLAAGESTPNNPIYTSDPLTLSPYQQLDVAPLVRVPLDQPAGRYRLALVADAADQVSEPNELNNQLVQVEDFRVADRRPDFRVPSVASLGANARPGETVTVVVVLENGGNLDSATDYTVHLSRNRVISADDLVVDTGTIALPLLTTATVSVAVDLPADLAPGVYYFGAVMDPNDGVAELDEVNNAGATESPFTVTTEELVIQTTDLPGGYVGVPYSVFLRAEGGDGAHQWSLASGSLPQGLALLASGEIRGTPLSRETSLFMVEVTSAALSAMAELTIAIEVIEGGLTIVTRQLLPGIVGAAYPPADPGTPLDQQQRIVAVGGTSEVRFTLKSVPPPGLVLDGNGYLNGVPLQEGDYDLVIEATDGASLVERTLILTVAEPGRLTLVAAVLPDAQLEDEYDVQLRLLGRAESSTVTFSTGGPLPDGIALTTAGTLVGVPQQVGTWIFTVRVEEQGGGVDTATFRLTVVQDAGFAIGPQVVPDGVVGEPYFAVVEAREGVPPFTWRVFGEPLPRGIIYEVTTDERQKLELKGIPEERVFVTFMVTVTDGDGRHAEQAMTMLIETPEPTAPMRSGDGCGCSVPARKPTAGPWLLGLLGVYGIMRRNGRSRR